MTGGSAEEMAMRSHIVLTALGFADKQLGMFLQWAHETDAGAAAGADPAVAACAQLLLSMGAAMQAVGIKTGNSGTLVQSVTTYPSKPDPLFKKSMLPHQDMDPGNCKSFAYQLKLAQQRKDAAELAAADPPASTRGTLTRGLSFRGGAKGSASQSAIAVAARAAAADYARAVSGDLGNQAVSGDMAIAIEAMDHHREDTFKLQNQRKGDSKAYRRPSNNNSAGFFGPGTAMIKPQVDEEVAQRTEGESAASPAVASNASDVGVIIGLRDNRSEAPSPEALAAEPITQFRPALPSGAAAVAEAAAPAAPSPAAPLPVPSPAVPSAAPGAAGVPLSTSKLPRPAFDLAPAVTVESKRRGVPEARAGPALSSADTSPEQTKRTHLLRTFDELMQQLEDDKGSPKSKGSRALSLKLSKTAAKELAEGDVDSPKAKGRRRRRSSVELDADQFLGARVHELDARVHEGVFLGSCFYPLVHPGSVFQTCWHVVMIIATILTGIIVPYSLAFEGAPASWMATSNVLPWAAFTVDVLLNFATGYNTDGYVVLDFPHISTRYLRTWLLPDLVSILPWDLMFGSSSGQLLKLTRLLRLKELVRVLRIHGIGDYIPDNQMRYLVTGLAVTRTLFALICVVHWSACVYFVLAKQEFHDLGFRACQDPAGGAAGRCSDWLPPSELMDSDDIAAKYNFAFFAMVSLTAGLGPGMHWPVHGAEIAFTSIMVVIGVFVISITIGNVTSAIAHMKSINNENTDKWHRIKLYLHSRL
jgi:hypothetical protein